MLSSTLPISEPAPLVMANLVATLHIELAPLLVGAMAPGGRLLTSGMFLSRADEAIAALQAAGATLVERWEEGEWVAAEFGGEVAGIVDGLSKLTRLEFESQAENQARRLDGGPPDQAGKPG